MRHCDLVVTPIASGIAMWTPAEAGRHAKGGRAMAKKSKKDKKKDKKNKKK